MPDESPALMSAPSRPRRIFVSYCRTDERWLARLRIHLQPLERESIVDIWDDRRLKPGTKWREAIRKAVESADIAILEGNRSS